MSFYRPHPRVSFETRGESRTKQSFQDETDINTIMAKFERTGLLEHVNNFNGDYGDYTDVPTDYHAAMNQVIEADAMFQTIPAKIRAQFNNDPGTFLAFADDPQNEDQMRSLGLLPSKLAAEQPPERTTATVGAQPAEIGPAQGEASTTPEGASKAPSGTS